MVNRAKQIREDAYTIFNTNINTYGAETLKHVAPHDMSLIRHGGLEACTRIGGLIKQFLEETGEPSKNIYQGICTASTFTRIVNDEIQQPDMYVLEGLMQRLGRDHKKYYNLLLIKHEFDEKQIRDEVLSLLVAKKYSEAEALLLTLKDSKRFKKGIPLQFVLSSKASILSAREGYTPEYEKMIRKAIKITMPHFDENHTARHRMTLEEITLVNMLALYYADKEKKETVRSIRLFKQLRTAVNRYYVDSSEMAKMYCTILYNLSKYQGIARKYDEALELIEEGEFLSRYYGRIANLPGFAINKACDLFEMGRKNESMPYFAMAYYGMDLIGRIKDCNIVRNYVKEHLGRDFD
jgi:tetratricopeptide (TPR) repeat protein